MLTLLLAAVLLVVAVAGAELVRSACRRQLMAAAVTPVPARQGRAAID